MIFSGLRRRLRRTETRLITVRFAMDRTEDNRHRVQVFKSVDGVEELVADPEALSRYGYSEMRDTPSARVIYVVDENQRQQLRAILSLKPEIASDGALSFSFAPRILGYLRTKGDTSESEKSGRLRVETDPLEPMARIRYDPQQGLEIGVGYSLDGDPDHLVSTDEVPTTADGEYGIFGDTFRPMKPGLTEAAKEWLKQTVRRVERQDIPEFFLRDLVLLKQEFKAVLIDEAQKIQILDDTVKPVVRVKSTEPGWLDFQIEYDYAGHRLPEGLLPKMVDHRFVQLDDTTWLKVNQSSADQVDQHLRNLGAEPIDGGYRLPITEFTSLEEFIEGIGGKAELSHAYQQFLDQLTDFRADEAFALSDAAESDLVKRGVQLRPYQRAGIHWLTWLQRNRVHGVLADDMGLGKTLQAIATVRHAYEQTASRQHSMVIAPKSVLPHWEREIRRFYPSASTYQYHGPQRKNLFNLTRPVIFISTYATVNNDVDILGRIPFFYLILDEATNIKNPDTGRTRAVKALNSAHRLALTGTPVENRPAELWSLFDFLMRGHLGRYGTFVNAFENRIVAGDQVAATRLGRRIYPFMLRREKSDVAKDLPEKIEMDEWCELTEEQRDLYGTLQSEVKGIYSALKHGEYVNYTTSILPVLTKLKQICDHPALITKQTDPLLGRSAKFDWITERISEIVEQGEQVVVFSHFLEMLNLLQFWLLPQSVPYIRIDGSTTKRQALIDKFNAGQASVALLSLMAAGHGINLTAANHVIHADRWWNPAIEDQATDRVHRIGQDKTVYVYRILVQGTLEERIDTLLANKRAMASSIVGAAGSRAGSWTREELLELLKPID